MGLDSIWDVDGEYLKRDSKCFSSRSTGCDCCSTTLDTEEEVKKEAIDSLAEIIVATEYFGWNLFGLIESAKKEEKYQKFIE